MHLPPFLFHTNRRSVCCALPATRARLGAPPWSVGPGTTARRGPRPAPSAQLGHCASSQVQLRGRAGSGAGCQEQHLVKLVFGSRVSIIPACSTVHPSCASLLHPPLLPAALAAQHVLIVPLPVLHCRTKFLSSTTQQLRFQCHGGAGAVRAGHHVAGGPGRLYPVPCRLQLPKPRPRCVRRSFESDN